MDLKRVLTIAGSDSSGGAGIQADLKTIAAHRLYGESAITALTAQNTCGVSGVLDVPPAFVAQQIDAVFDDIRPDAVKIGMVSAPAIVGAIAERLRHHGAAHVVVDPVMVATSGADLMGEGTPRALVDELFPLAEVVTPNIPEASVLAGFDAAGRGLDSMVEAARAVARLTPGAVLVKGGHLEGEDAATDVLLLPGQADPLILRGVPVATANTHGTGCTLSSAIACNLALGKDAAAAVEAAKRYLERCLASGLDLGRGSGPLDHMAAYRGVPQPQPAAERPVQPQGAPAERRCRVLVVGGSPERPRPELLRALALQADLVVACDSGADACRSAEVLVDALVGDEDSVSDGGLAYARAAGAQELTFPEDKDAVDLALALEWVRENVPDVLDVTLTGVTGGRADHGLAALGLAARAADLCPAVEENDASYRVLSPVGRPEWAFSPSDRGRTASVVALLGPAVVSERGMRWDLDRATLGPLGDLGVSNVVESNEGAAVEVHEGVVLVCLLRDRVTKVVRA